MSRVFVFFFFFVIIWLGVLNTRWSEDNWHIHQLTKKAEAQKADYSSNGLYSLDAAFRLKSEYALQLCHRALYEVERLAPDGPDVLVLSDHTHQLGRAYPPPPSLVLERKQYAIDTRFLVRYNVPDWRSSASPPRASARPASSRISCTWSCTTKCRAATRSSARCAWSSRRSTFTKRRCGRGTRLRSAPTTRARRRSAAVRARPRWTR